jgi:GPH family glycoside/pentoside/hexuronide:cation symporter
MREPAARTGGLGRCALPAREGFALPSFPSVPHRALQPRHSAASPTPPPIVITSPSSGRLSFKEKFAYGLGDTASNFYFQAFNLFLAYYYIDVMGLGSQAAGTLIGVVPIAVAFLNPVIGAIADRTNTRWGKFRPWILWGALPYGVLGYVMFANPALAAGPKLVFAYATYTLVLIAYAAINTPYGALMGVMSPSSEDRTSLNSYRFACAFLGALLIGSLVPVLKNFLTPAGGTAADGFRNTMAIFAVLSVGMFLFTFAHTRERVAATAQQQGRLREDLRDLTRNGPWLVLCGVAIFNLTNTGLRNAAGVFYFKYNVGDELAQGSFNFFGFLCFILGALATKWFTARWSRRGLMIWLTLVNGAGITACYFVDPHNLPVLYALNIVASFAAGPTPAIVWSLYADTVDYGEWKFGRRATGLLISAMVLMQKISLAVGGALLGFLLDHYGFVANAVQSPRAVHGITVLFSLVPGALALMAGLVTIFYTLDEPQVKQIEHELAGRKGIPAAI